MIKVKRTIELVLLFHTVFYYTYFIFLWVSKPLMEETGLKPCLKILLYGLMLEVLKGTHTSLIRHYPKSAVQRSWEGL